MINEVAPPTKKHERMVKHIKKAYGKKGGLSDEEKSIAYATAWKNYNEAFKQFPEKKVSRKIQREKDRLSAGDLAGSKASGSQIQGRQQQLNRKRAGRIMKMSRTMNSKTSTSSNERMKMNSSAQKTTRTVDRIKDRQTGSDTSKGRPRRWSLEPKLKDK